MTSSVRFNARPVPGESPAGVDATILATIPVISFGDRELTEDQVLWYKFASLRAQELPDTQQFTDTFDNVAGPEFERDRAAWKLAKEVVEFSIELGGDMSIYLDQLSADPSQKVKAARFIPAALDAHQMLQIPIG